MNNKYTTRWIIALLSLALLGLLCVQIYWVNNAVDLKRELFRQSVNGAMSAVISKLEKREVASAVAQTVYAATTPPPTPAPDAVCAIAPIPQAPPSAPATPPSPPAAAGSTTSRQYSQSSYFSSIPTSQPVIVSSSRAPNGSSVAIGQSNAPATTAFGYSANTPQNRVFVQSGRHLGFGQRQEVPVQFVHIDSMRNMVRMYLDPAMIDQQAFVNRMPRIAINRPRENNRPQRQQRSVTLSTHMPDSATAMQWQQSAQMYTNAYNDGMEVNVTINNLEQRIEEIHSMMGEVFEEPITVELSNIPSFPQEMWVRESWPQQDTVVTVHGLTDGMAPATRERSSKSKKASALGAASSTSVSSNRRPARSHTQAHTERAIAVNAADEQKSDRDKLVSINAVASRVVAELATGYRPITQRLSPDLLDSLLRLELAQRGISLPYRYAVLSQKNSFALAKPASYSNELQKSTFRAALYPNDIITEPYFLSIYFPRQDEFVYESMWGVLGTSLLFILLILGCFSFTLVTLARQKKLSDMKTDFINNMTHEFKTPIATISLASEALRDPAVRGSDNRVMRFINAIYEENRRLGSQVERVLQAAVVDRGEVRLTPATVCVHDVMRQALQTIALQVESRGGTVECRFEAEQDCILADRVHLGNVIVNLLDNANKYSPDSPCIVLSTASAPGGIIISVEDNGIGMSRDVQKRIFEQFYRVPTGNVHDVKGFGLGLSYVKAMVEAHGGTIALRSEPKQGSRFDLFFPFAGKEVAQA